MKTLSKIIAETEQTAKVIIKKHDNKSLTSLGIVFSDETFLCGNCNYILDINWDYCPHCGAKLDWSWNE